MFDPVTMPVWPARLKYLGSEGGKIKSWRPRKRTYVPMVRIVLVARFSRFWWGLVTYERFEVILASS